MTEQEATAGGTIGKLAGRAKLQQVQSEAEKDAAALAGEAKQKEGEAELEAGDLKQKAQRAEEAANLIEHKGKS